MDKSNQTKYRLVLEAYYKTCKEADELTLKCFNQCVDDIRKKKEAQKENRQTFLIPKKIDETIETHRPKRRAAETAKSLISSSFKYEGFKGDLKRPKELDTTRLMSTMDFFKEQMQKGGEGFDHSLNEENFVKDLKKKHEVFESTLITANDKKLNDEGIVKIDYRDLNKLEEMKKSILSLENTIVAPKFSSKTFTISDSDPKVQDTENDLNYLNDLKNETKTKDVAKNSESESNEKTTKKKSKVNKVETKKMLNLSDIVEENFDGIDQVQKSTKKKIEEKTQTKTSELVGILTRAMAKKLEQNDPQQQFVMNKMDARKEEAVKNREKYLEKRRAIAREKREERIRKVFEQRELLKKEELEKLNQNKKAKQNKPTTKKPAITKIQNEPRPKDISSSTQKIIVKSNNIKKPISTTTQTNLQVEIKHPKPQLHKDDELLSLNLSDYESDTNDENKHTPLKKITDWVLKREYDSQHAESSLLLDLFLTGPCQPKLEEIFDEYQENQLLRNSSIWEDEI